MRPVFVTVSAPGYSPWVPLNRLQIAFGVGMGVVLSNGATATYTVQHTFDELGPDGFHHVSLSQSATTVTVTDPGMLDNNLEAAPGHGLSVGDSVIIQNSGSSICDGTFSVASVVSATQYTYTAGSSQTYSDKGNTQACGLRVFPHSSLSALTARADGNYAFPVSAVRLYASALTGGFATLIIQQAMGR